MTMLMEAKRTSDRVTGFSNVTFDLLSILTRKLQGIAAMEEYKIDCRDEGDTEAFELIEQMERVAAADVTRLRTLLRDRL